MEQERETDLPETLELLRHNELAIGALYDDYAALFPSHASLWITMAEEERQHAQWIEELGIELQSSRRNTRPRFSPESIKTFTAYVREQSDAAHREQFTAMAALTTSYYIETALIERRFFEQLTPNDPANSPTLSRLKHATEQHVARIRDALHQDRPGSL
ncbi:MAG: hypothetical protein JW846_04340 [Dehalococcoidia bacterium]|nr:hypothetical protein [Dehalococcoidia bacterium]